MGLRSVILGYADAEVDEAAFTAARSGNNLSRVTPDELEVAELLTEVIPGAEMVKFGKNGSDATAGAIRLARAATGRDIILRCSGSSFLGVHDWFIGSTVMSRGVPVQVRNLTQTFPYNDVDALSVALDRWSGSVAAVILEPVGVELPAEGYLQQVKNLTHDAGALLIFDETITGFRIDVSGAQSAFGVIPDLGTFGKAMANGYPLSALVGLAQFMKLGGIDHDEERVFLMSSTYGAERPSLAACRVTINRLRDGKVLSGNRRFAEGLMAGFRQLIERHGLADRILTSGLDLLPLVRFQSIEGEEDNHLKTLFMQEMVSEGILMAPYFMSMSAAHREDEVTRTLEAADSVLCRMARWIEDGSATSRLEGERVRAVFRKRNYD